MPPIKATIRFTVKRMRNGGTGSSPCPPPDHGDCPNTKQSRAERFGSNPSHRNYVAWADVRIVCGLRTDHVQVGGSLVSDKVRQVEPVMVSMAAGMIGSWRGLRPCFDLNVSTLAPGGSWRRSSQFTRIFRPAGVIDKPNGSGKAVASLTRRPR